MRVAVFGARGTLGAAIVQGFPGSDVVHDVFAFDRSTVDITSHESVERAIRRVNPDVLINCAAYNAVDAAEDHAVDALMANAFAVRTLARAARAHDVSLVHYSSDFVFDGTAGRPHTEADPPNPRSVWAARCL